MDERHALTVLTRLAARRPQQVLQLRRALERNIHGLAPMAMEVAQETGDPMGDVLADLMRATADPGLAFQLHDACPKETVSLDGLAVVVTQLCVAALRQLDGDRRLVGYLSNLSTRLRVGGRHGEALAVAEEAVAACGASTPVDDNALALYGLANAYVEVGRLADALSVSDRALTLARSAAQGRDDDPDLGTTLNLQAVILSRMGQFDGALIAAAEASDVLRAGLAHQRRGDQAATLAHALMTQANILTDMDRHREALLLLDEGVEIFRRLADGFPDAYLGSLSDICGNRGVVLSELGYPRRALEASREALTIDRELARRRPQSHRARLATSLNNHAHRLHDVGRLDEGLDCVEEAVAVQLSLDPSDLLESMADLGMIYDTACILLHSADRLEEAELVGEQSVAIYRHVAADLPVHLPSLAGSLQNLAAVQAGKGDREGSLLGAMEALRIFKEAEERTPGQFLPELAMTSNTVAAGLSGVDDEAALQVAFDAVEAYRQLSATSPDKFNAPLAMALDGFARAAGALDQHELAVTASGEGLALRRGQGEAGDLSDLVAALLNHSACLFNAQEPAAAAAAALEAVDAARVLAARRRGRDTRLLPFALNNWAAALMALAQAEEAAGAAREALTLFLPLLEASPVQYADQALSMLTNHDDCHAAAGLPVDGPLRERYEEILAGLEDDGAAD